MIGIPDALGRLVRRRRPVDERTDEEWMQVWLTPSRPAWSHIPYSEMDGPFRLIRASTDTEAVFTFEEHDELSTALQALTDRCLPIPEQRCAIIDNKDRMILGWIDYHQPNVLEADEERYAWFGCQSVFRLLAIIHNPVDAAFWERLANPEGQ